MHTAAISEAMQQDTSSPTDTAHQEILESGVLAFPASISQQVFWYMELLQGEVTAFNVPLRFRLTGPLNPALLEQTMNIIIERHEALRTYFAEDRGELLQIVLPELSLKIPLIDIAHLPADRHEEESDRLGSIEARRPFRLSTGPMIRAELVRLSPEHHVFHVTVHHALFDGLSMTVLTKEIAEIYQALYDGRHCPLDPLPIQYGDFSVWQKDFLDSPEMEKQLSYWKQRLQGMTELELPTDFPRPPVKSWKGDITSILLPKELTDRLQAIAARNGATLFHLQLAAYCILLSRYTSTRDVAVGTPVTGRTREELEPLMGVFINSLILRNDLSGNPDFESLLRNVRETALEALENQDLPFECLVRELRPERDQSRNPLFQVNFNHHRSFAQPGSFGGVTLTPVPSRSPGTIFDLHFFMVERKEGWRASCDYSTDLFSSASANRMLGHFKRLLEDIAQFPERKIEELSILTDSETTWLDECSGTKTNYPSESTIGELFVETAAKYPQKTALRSSGTAITYQQLHSDASQLALKLLDRGLTTGDLVAIASTPGPEMIIGTLAILLAGGCCVPLDPSYPKDRFSKLLSESGARIALAHVNCVTAYPMNWGGTILTIPASGSASAPSVIPENDVTSTHPAHLLFTSGSTGEPKGVLLPHRGIVRLVKNNGFMPIQPDDVFLQAAPVSFDASLLEMWGALLNGGTLVLMPHGPTLEGIADAVVKQGVTILWLTSGLFQLMMDENPRALKSLRFLLAGGDVLSPPHVRKAWMELSGTTLINGYGPTENTTFTTCRVITRDDLDRPSIPIGAPIANTSIFLLDELLRPVPVGIPGELFTGGDGLAIGYHNAPELTSQKFIEHPRYGRLYRTGDLCRRSADGTLEFIGRRDHQVKVRGFRIELGEIEAMLLSHPDIREAKAAVRGDTPDTKRILAWVTLHAARNLESEAIIRYLADRLPSFMRPDAIGIVTSLPLNANGKVKISALPDPGQSETAKQERIYHAPQSPTELYLAKLWSELLGVNKISRDADFFALGGHSLMALKMFARINRELDKTLPLATLLQHPTLAALAAILAPKPQEADTSSSSRRGNIVTLVKGNPASQSPLFCIHGGDGGVIFYRGLAQALPSELPVHAIESLELGNSGQIHPYRIEETAESYVKAMLGIQSKGPFRLAGYSYGGVVAYEMACLLTNQGYQVEFLGLFDTHNPASTVRSYSMQERLGVFWKQNSHVPLTGRLDLVKSRFIDGVKTNLRVKAELKAAVETSAPEPYSDTRRVQVREENWRSMLSYSPSPFEGKVTLFKAMQQSDKVERALDYGWSCLAGGGFDIIPVPGDHLTLFNPENIPPLAKALCDSLPRISQ